MDTTQFNLITHIKY